MLQQYHNIGYRSINGLYQIIDRVLIQLGILSIWTLHLAAHDDRVLHILFLLISNFLNYSILLNVKIVLWRPHFCCQYRNQADLNTFPAVTTDRHICAVNYENYKSRNFPVLHFLSLWYSFIILIQFKQIMQKNAENWMLRKWGTLSITRIKILLFSNWA